MPLTYQPFAEAPALAKLDQDLHMNVPDPERGLSALLGGALIATSLAKHGLLKWVFLAAGAALVRRGWVGHCPLYQQFQMDRRHAA